MTEEPSATGSCARDDSDSAKDPSRDDAAQPRVYEDIDQGVPLLLAQHAVGGRLALYCGSGLSRGAPTHLVVSAELADWLEAKLPWLLDVEEWSSPQGPRTLEQIADAVDARGADFLSVLKNTLAQYPGFKTRFPNDAHRAVALLLEEGLAEVMSTNWDLCIERAAAEYLAFPVVPILDAAGRRASVLRYRFLKICGCVNRPDSLLVTSREIGQPPSWVVDELRASLSGGSVVFVGTGTLPESLREAVLQITRQSLTGSKLVVVVPELSSDWKTLANEAVGIDLWRGSGEVFLGRMLESLVRLALSELASAAGRRVLSGVDPELQDRAATVAELLRGVPALPLLNWLRSGAGGLEAGAPFVSRPEATDSLMALVDLAADAMPQLTVFGERLTVSLGSAYVEIAHWPGTTATAMMDSERSRVERIRGEGRYALSSASVIHLCLGFDGVLPQRDVAQDLLDSADHCVDIVDGPEQIDHVWVPVTDYLRGNWRMPR